MIKFKEILQEELNNDSLNWWSTYARTWIFDSEENARKWIIRTMQNFYNPLSDEAINKEASEIPLYKSGKSWKIGKRIRLNKRFSWDNINIESNSLEELETDGYVNIFDVESLSSIKMISIDKIIPTEKHAIEEDENETINYARKIKKGEIEEFKAIVLDDNFAIIDGHHRYYAVKISKINKIPYQMITYND